jgi:hypothetical protein
MHFGHCLVLIKVGNIVRRKGDEEKLSTLAKWFAILLQSPGARLPFRSKK